MTLKEALDLAPDPRSSQGRRHSLGAILALATCVRLRRMRRSSASGGYAIAQWGRDHHRPLAQALGYLTPQQLLLQSQPQRKEEKCHCSTG